MQRMRRENCQTLCTGFDREGRRFAVTRNSLITEEKQGIFYQRGALYLFDTRLYIYKFIVEYYESGKI